MKNGKKRRAWTSVQVRELKTMARKKAPAAKIAKKLKRSEGARDKKRSVLDCRSTRAHNRQKPKYSPFYIAAAKPRRSRARGFAFKTYRCVRFRMLIQSDTIPSKAYIWKQSELPLRII